MSLVDGGDTTLVHIVFVIKDSLKDPSLEIGSQSIPLQQGNQFPTVWKCSIDGDWLSGLVQTRQNRANLKASSTRLLFLSQTIEHSFTLQRKSHIFVMDKEDFTGFSRKSESIAVLVKFAVSEMAGESIRAGWEFIKAITQEYSGFLQYLSKEQFHELVKLEVEPKERLINTILLSAVIPSFINNKFLALLRDCDIEDEALLEALSRNAAWMQCKQLVQHGLQKDDFSFLPLCLYYPKQLETIASTFVIGSKGNPSVSLLENLGFIQTRIPQDKEYSICRAIVSCASSVYDILIIASKATALIPLLESNDDFREFFKAQMRSKIEGGNACFLIETWQQVCKMEEIKILSIEILRTAIKQRPSVRNNDEASDLVNLLMFNELFTAEERTERLCLWLNDERISNEVVLRFTEIIDSLKPKLAHTLLDKLTKKGKLTLFHLIKCLRAFQPTNRELFSELDVESLIAKLWNAVIALPFDNSIQTFEREEFRCLLGEFLEMYQPALTRKFNSFSADLEHYFKILFDVNKGIAKERFDYSYATLEYCIIPSAESSDRYSDISIPSIVKHIGFWTCITKIANKDKIYSTSLLKKVRAVINKEYKAQIEGTYSVEQYLKKVKELQKNLSHIFEEFVENYANQQLDIIYQKIDHSTSSLGFVKQVLVSIGGSIREKYLQFVQQKLNEFPRTKVSELLSASYWGELWEWKEQLIKLSSLAQSASFMSTIVKNQQPNAFSNLNDLMRYLISMEKHLIEKWTHILNGTAVISDVYEIYYHIQNKQHEIQLIEKYMNKQLTHSAKENIAFLQQNFGFITDAQHILDLLELCNLSGQFKTLLEEYANTNFNNMLLSDFKKRTITITKNLTLQNFEVAHTIVECKDVFFL
ncbi:hypothetical protein C9374_011677 [Naegleria lovaniensis]|uniref:Uncharacterized protein n=1 Tax=Naegleria lovaniensis TaxID=51637 RepID=A0AA88G9Y4_NAELO|nr:uncharacterized protein C9374_011677 [Naegleria lovaniensis]KAG2374012.1 hypothetical protein C9374_011677 [Naegleria lovaniensis]